MNHRLIPWCGLAILLANVPAYAAGIPAPATKGPHATVTRALKPGESTPEARRILVWTLIAAPIGAYLLSHQLDHRLSMDDRGIWKRSNQLNLAYLTGLAEVGGAAWLGGGNRLGHTLWQSVDASVATGITVQAMKYTFTRARPRYHADDRNTWFQGSCCYSFPSGEVSFQASFVTPIIAEYHRQDPWVWALEVLPVYDAVARMKVQGHWQTDVLAGWAIGTAWGIYAHFEPKPFILSVMPHGIAIGIRARF